jgi:hypothetical protein
MPTKAWNQITALIMCLSLLLAAFASIDPGAALSLLPSEPNHDELRANALSLTSTSASTGIVRYEEDDPALLYNGLPYDQRPSSWREQFQSIASGGYTARSITADDTASLTFTAVGSAPASSPTSTVARPKFFWMVSARALLVFTRKSPMLKASRLATYPPAPTPSPSPS